MKTYLLSILVFLFTSVSLAAQSQIIVVKFSGDTLYCDQVNAGGKTIICKTKGQEKIKLLASEVSYYLEPSKTTVVEGGKTIEVDTFQKSFVPEDGKIHTVLMENESYYLTCITKTIDGMEFNDFYVMTKKNVEVVEVKETKVALDQLIKYFGGTCPQFDQQIAAVKPKFDKKIFPIGDWWDLIYFYNHNCKN